MSGHNHDSPEGCRCYAAGYADAQESIEGRLADAFDRHPESNQKAWQDVLHSVATREYQRGLREGLADD